MANPQVVVPTLEHDAMMLSRFGHTVSVGGHNERRIVAAMIAHLDRAGFSLTTVYDGEENTRVHTAKAAMELIFNLDEASVRFRKSAKTPIHGVLLIMGNGNNGQDIITDWNYSEDDADGFNAAMNAFIDDELFE